MEQKERYMRWINEFAKASFSLYSGNTISAFQPLDFFHFYGIWYDLWLERVIQAMEKIDAENKSFKELQPLLPTPSNLRALLQKAIPPYFGTDKSKKVLYARYTNFIARMLMEACPEDPFGLSRTPLHNQSEVEKIIRDIPWQPASAQEARLLGKLITAAGSLVHGLYNDVVTDFGWDAYGPYNNQAKDDEKYTLLVRDFPDLLPTELWGADFTPSVKSVQIYQLYQNVEWVIGCVGCHTIVKSGDPITGLKYYVVLADGKILGPEELRVLIMELATKAEKIYLEIRKKNFEELKEMVMLQECYQLKKLFEAAGLDWKPTARMKEIIKDKPLQTGILPHDVMMTNLEQYKKVFHLNEFEDEVLKV